MDRVRVRDEREREREILFKNKRRRLDAIAFQGGLSESESSLESHSETPFRNCRKTGDAGGRGSHSATRAHSSSATACSERLALSGVSSSKLFSSKNKGAGQRLFSAVRFVTADAAGALRGSVARNHDQLGTVALDPAAQRARCATRYERSVSEKKKRRRKKSRAGKGSRRQSSRV